MPILLDDTRDPDHVPAEVSERCLAALDGLQTQSEQWPITVEARVKERAWLDAASELTDDSTVADVELVLHLRAEAEEARVLFGIEYERRYQELKGRLLAWGRMVMDTCDSGGMPRGDEDL